MDELHIYTDQGELIYPINNRMADHVQEDTIHRILDNFPHAHWDIKRVW